jgi:hypothetical protein
LREQIASHIDEAAAADASDEEVAAVPRGLGSPRLLVAEAAATAGRRLWAARVGWRGWALIGALVLAAAVSGYFIRIHSLDPLFVEGSSAWWYPQDIEVFNVTAMMQTVLGSNPGGFGPNGGTSVALTLSTSDPDHARYDPHAVTYALPVSIPLARAGTCASVTADTAQHDNCAVTFRACPCSLPAHAEPPIYTPTGVL